MSIRIYESLPPETVNAYSSDVYSNLRFLVHAKKPHNCRFLLADETPDSGAICIWKHPSPEIPLLAVFSTGVPDTQMSLFRALEPGKYLFIVPEGDLEKTLAQELRFTNIHRNRVYALDSDSHLDPGEARLLGSDDVPNVERIPPHLARRILRGEPVFGIIKDGVLIASCTVHELIDRYWAIGNVLTQEAFRRRGYGKSVVSAAVNHALSCGRVPFYECDKENIASIRLAESLGFSLKATQLEAEAYTN